MPLNNGSDCSSHKGYEMSYKLKVTLLKIQMVGRARGHYVLWDEEYKEYNDDTWKRWLLRVQDYATKRRLEANLTEGEGDPMGITEVNYGLG